MNGVYYAPGYFKGPDSDPYIRLLSPYMGEAFPTLNEAKNWVEDEGHNQYMQIVYFEVHPVAQDG